MSQPKSQSFTALTRIRFRAALIALLLMLQALTVISSMHHPSDPVPEGQQNISEATAAQRYRRSEHRYKVGNFELLDQQGRKTDLQSVLANDQGVLLNFIFTGCTTLCPLMSATFAKVHQKLVAEHRGLRLISISIDPDQDGPQQLGDFWRRFGGGAQWQLFTGERNDVIAIQKAFGVFQGKKANHRSVIFLKRPGGGTWLRLDGYPTAADIVAEFDRFGELCTKAC